MRNAGEALGEETFRTYSQWVRSRWDDKTHVLNKWQQTKAYPRYLDRLKHTTERTPIINLYAAEQQARKEAADAHGSTNNWLDHLAKYGYLDYDEVDKVRISSGKALKGQEMGLYKLKLQNAFVGDQSEFQRNRFNPRNGMESWGYFQ